MYYVQRRSDLDSSPGPRDSLVPRPHPQVGEGLVTFERFLGPLCIIRKARLNQLEVFEVLEIALLLAKLSQKNITQTKETRGDT